jgi:hypothetical protein
VVGLFTVAGRQSYDEMDGLYPLIAGVAAAIMALGAAALMLVAWVRR